MSIEIWKSLRGKAGFFDGRWKSSLQQPGSQACFLRTARINGGRRGGVRYGNDSDLDRDGGGLHPVRSGDGKRTSGGGCGHGGGGRGGGAVPVHGGGALPVDGGDGGDAPLRPVGWAVPAAPAGAAAALPGVCAGPGGDGHHLGQRVGQPAGAGQCGHSPGHPGRPADEPPHSRTGLRRFVYAGGVQYGVHPAHSHHGGLGAAGCAAPFDILPAVWLASVISVCAGIGAVKLFGRVWRG